MEENIVLRIDNKGRLTIPLNIRKSLNINSGDIFFIKPEKFGLHIAKVDNPFEDLVEYAKHERKKGKSIDLRAYAEKNKIGL